MTEPGHDAAASRPSRHARRHGPASRRVRSFATVARLAGPPAALSVVATVVLAVVLVTLEGSRGLAVNVWLLTIGGLLVWTCLRALARALPTAAASAFDSVRVRPVEPPSKLNDVTVIVGVILDAEWSLSGVEFRLRPLLRKIAAARLIERHQIDLETEPAAAHRILGDELWALVGPGAHSPAGPASSDIEVAKAALAVATRSDSGTPAQPPTAWTRNHKGRRGIPRATIRRAIDVLEAL